MRQATLVLLVREREVLLAMKKRGFGAGKWNGVGGKPETRETIENAAAREAREEIGVEIAEISEVGRIDFLFPHNPDWSQQVVVFTARKWKGEPIETEEMAPRWFKFEEVPYKEMWKDDKYWMPKVFEGKRIRGGEFVFKEGDEIEKMTVEEI